MSRGMHKFGRTVFAVWVMMVVSVSRGQIPDHPIITEVFNNPTGTDGPVGRDPANRDQEYIEIYLPTAANLRAGLNKDALHLTFYEIEGDSGNSKRGWVNQRFDLPTFDLDGGSSPPVVNRPSSGVVVLGWVDYNSPDPAVLPTDLKGTPSTRLGLINIIGGITTSPPGTVFVAMNGAQFGGTTNTTNFPVPVAESFIDIPNEQVDGVMTNGSIVYLLVNRDDPNYVSLGDSAHFSSDADLPGGTVLGISSLLDGIAGNDDLKFTESAQPYVFPTGRSIDLEDILRSGGVFTSWVAQIAEGSGGGYARRFVDQLRTTEDGIAGNENPATDAQVSYRQISRDGPFYPTPGRVTLTTSPPELGVGEATRQTFSVLAGTTGRPGLISANLGGNCPIDITATPGACIDPNPCTVTFGSAAAATGILGQSEAFPQIAVTVPASAADGATASASVSFSATNTAGGCNPPPTVVNSMQVSGTTITVLKPTTGLDASVPPSPFQATVFLAVQGLGANPAVDNEFLPSSLGTFVAARQGVDVWAALNHVGALLNPSTNLEDNCTMDPLKLVFPSLEADFINALGATEDLVTTVLNSAKIASGSTAYAGALNGSQTAVKAIQIPIPETLTKGGAFSASDVLFFANSTGDVFNERSGLSRVTTSRTFELAILDTNMTADPVSPIESGDADDFGLIVQVGRVRLGASVVSGELLFLSFMGGLEGEDIDTLDVPGANATVAILLDLDNLDDVLGCQTITKLFVVDSGGAATLNVVEVFSLAANLTCTVPANCDDGQFCNGAETCGIGGICQAGTPPNCSDGVSCTTDMCNESTNSCDHLPNVSCCDDGNACTTDSCDTTTGCVHTFNTGPCNDGNACTTNDACSGGSCVGGPALNCNDGNVCTDDSCNTATGCVHTNNTALCTDGNACTTNDACAGGTCVGGLPLNCVNDGLFCTGTESCDPASGCVSSGNPCINPANCNEDTNACTGELSAPVPDPSGGKTRALSFTVPPPASGAGMAIKVTMIDLQHPNPRNLPQYPPLNLTTFDTRLNGVCVGGVLVGHHCDTDADCSRLCVGGSNANRVCTGDGDCPFGTCPAGGTCSNLAACTAAGEANGCARWVGKPGTFYEFQGPPQALPYRASRLQCTPVYWDWITETATGPITVVGAEIVPSSEYSVQTYAASCKGAEAGCTNVSAQLTMYTRRKGDLEETYQTPSPATLTQADAIDVAQSVNAVKHLLGAPSHARAQMQPNLPDLNTDCNVLDIVEVVDSLKRTAYSFPGPCPCPSTVTCGGSCTGCAGLCVKVCTGGDNVGEPCINNNHCPGDGACSAVGTCRDKCGRCTP